MTLRELKLWLFLEAVFCASQAQLLAQGVMLTREIWFNSPGWPVMYPIDAARLAQQGYSIAGWQAILNLAPPPPKLSFSYRN